MKKLMLPVAVIILFFSFIVNPSMRAAAEKEWKVAIHTGMEPFSYYNEDRNLTGIDIDILQIIAEEEEADCEIIDVDFDEIFPMLERGEIDFAISAITITEERQSRALFSDTYLTTCSRILLPEDSGIGSFQELEEKWIAVIEGSDDEAYLRSIGYEKLVYFSKDYDSYQLLCDREADAIMIDEEIAKVIKAAHEELILMEEQVNNEQYAIAVPFGQEELLAALNHSLATLKETGELNKIIGKYIVQDPEQESEEMEEEQ